MSRPDTANAEQSAKWNDQAGRSWAELGDMLDRLLEPFVPLLLDEIGPVAGRRILDVGCGAGALTLAAAGAGRRAASAVDISAPADRSGAGPGRAPRPGHGRIRPGRCPDPPASARRASTPSISRFGVMFFADPAAAFRNLRSAARPGARLACLAWRGAAENDFMTAAERAAADLLPEMPKRAEDGPGQFGFADPDRVRAILADGGWREAAIRPVDVTCAMPERDLGLYARRMGPVGERLPTLEGDARVEVERRVDAAFLPWVEKGEARFTAACWMVTARA